MSSSERSQFSAKLSRQRWLIWLVAILAHSIGILHRASMASMADRIIADFNISAVAFGNLSAVYFYTYGAMQIPSGTLADVIGPRRIITAGITLSAIGSIIMSMAPSFGIIYMGRLIVSFGVSLLWMSVVRLIMEWFRTNEVATLTGLSSSVANLGQVAAATPLALLITWVDWRMSFMVITLFSIFVAAADWFIIRDTPTEVAHTSVEQVRKQTNVHFDTATTSIELSLTQRFKIIFGNKYLWPLFLISLGAYGSYTTFFHSWAVVYGMQIYGLQRSDAATFILLAAVGMIIGGPLIGVLSDRLFKNRRLPLVIFAGISLISFLLFAFWNGGRPPKDVLYILCFLIGLGTSVMPITFVVAGELVQPSVRSTACGLVNMGGFIGSAIAQSLFGYILDLGWTGEILDNVRVYPLGAFQNGILLCSILSGLGFIGALLTKEANGGVN